MQPAAKGVTSSARRSPKLPGRGWVRAIKLEAAPRYHVQRLAPICTQMHRLANLAPDGRHSFRASDTGSCCCFFAADAGDLLTVRASEIEPKPALAALLSDQHCHDARDHHNQFHALLHTPQHRR